MRRRWLIAICLLLSGAVLVVLGLKLVSPRQPDPRFAGRTVRQWLYSTDYQTNRVAVQLAVVALGEKSVPALRRMLRSGTWWQRVWFAKTPAWLYRLLPLGGYQFERKDRALWAIGTLGRDGQEATPDLLAVLQDPTEHWNQRYGAFNTLFAVQAQPSLVIPVMDKLTNDPAVGKFAADYLAMRKRADAYQSEHSWGAVTKTGSRTPEAAKPEFKPASSFLDQDSLWGPTNARRSKLVLGTNAPLIRPDSSAR